MFDFLNIVRIFLDKVNGYIIFNKVSKWDNNLKNTLQVFSLKINVEDIPSYGLELISTLDKDGLLDELQFHKGEEFRLYSPVSFSLKVTKSHRNIFLKGRVCTNLILKCSRCLKDVDYPLRSDLEYTFCSTKEEGFVDDLELSSEDLGVSFYQGKEIDLSQVIIEHIVMAVPFKPLCQSLCKGLCPNCGIDLNEDICECAKDSELNVEFSGLRNFKIENRG